MQTYPTGYTESHRMAEKIFRKFYPGMAWRCARNKSRFAMKF